MNSEDKSRILVVDNYKPIANSLKSIIERSFPNFDVIICEDADEVLRQIGHSEIFLILSNVEETGEVGESGIGLLEMVKDESPQTKFIVMIGDSCNTIEVKKAGADGFLAKPFTSDSLEKIIIQTIGQSTS